MRAVATIPAGVTLDAALAAMKGMGDCYPPETLSLSNDPSGGMLVLYAERPDGAEPEPAPRMVIEVGAEPENLLAFAFTAAEGDEQDGLKAMALGMIRMLENAGAQNYLALTIEVPDVGRYGINIQRCDGKTPAERIAELETQIANRARLGTAPYASQCSESVSGMCLEMTEGNQRCNPGGGCIRATGSSPRKEG